MRGAGSVSMSWSVTIDNLPEFKGLSEDVLSQMMSQHPMYPADMGQALKVARGAALKSCVLTGFRTPSPYDQDEVVEITVRGMMKATDYVQAIKNAINTGPSPEAAATLMGQMNNPAKDKHYQDMMAAIKEVLGGQPENR